MSKKESKIKHGDQEVENEGFEDNQDLQDLPKIPIMAEVVVVKTPSGKPFIHNPKDYHLIKADEKGNPIDGKDVNVGVNSFNRTFKRLTEGKNPKYIIISEPKKK